MPYAAEGIVSTEQMPGAIQITDDQYKQAIVAMVAGKFVTVKGGFQILDELPVDPPPPPPPPTLEEAQTSKIAELSASCQLDIYAGFHSSALGADFLYPAKPTDQQNLASSVLASILPGQPTDWTTPFWCADGTGSWAFRVHTAAQIQDVGKDAKARILACMAQNVALAAQATAAETVQAVQAIEWISP